MKNKIIKTITKNAIVAAIYFVFTVVFSPISFGLIQLRFAEILVLLCFFNKDYIFGVSIGCMFANLFSSIGFWDVLFGTLATILSCILVACSKRLFVSTIFPVVINGFVVGTEYFILVDQSLPYFAVVGLIALGEAISVSIIGFLLFHFLSKNKNFLELISSNKKLVS